MRKRRKGRIYVKDPKNGRLCGDFRNLGGECEALIPPGEKRATTDWDVAGKRLLRLSEMTCQD
jgi:hypothetical protein